MTEQKNKSDRCLNCHADLDGPFCGQCGQARSTRLVPVMDWLGDFFGTFLKLDSKLLRTTKRILLQPGQATLDFGAGHRVPFSSPARVYIIVSAISIAAMTLQGVFSQPAAIPGMDASADFQKKVQFLFPFVNLFSPFGTAAILAMYQRGLFFQLHLAFSLHFWAFMVAVTTPLIFIPPTSVWSFIAFMGLCIVSSVYLFLAHRRVYVMPTLHRVLICLILLLSVPLTCFLFGGALFFLAFLLS